MASVRIRCVRLAIRLLIRRRDWGPPHALARRARRLFGAPRLYGWFRSFGVDVTPSAPGDPPGEWIVPRVRTSRTLLYLHGGGFVSCSPATHRPITAALARLTPARVFAVAYRLAPEHPHPAALDDAERAYAWLCARDASSAIAVGGDSAGGGLALSLLLRLRDHGATPPACAVLLSPWTDLAGSSASIRENVGRCAMFRPENMSAFALCYAPVAAWKDPAVSPAYGRLNNLAPLHVQVGRDELLRDDAIRVHHLVLEAGGVSELVAYDGVFHGWQMLDGLVPEARHALQRAARFLREVGAEGSGQ
jgi:acetyl esterase/lipase